MDFSAVNLPFLEVFSFAVIAGYRPVGPTSVHALTEKDALCSAPKAMAERPRFSLSLYDGGDEGQYGIGLVLIASGFLRSFDCEDHHQSRGVINFAKPQLVTFDLYTTRK